MKVLLRHRINSSVLRHSHRGLLTINEDKASQEISSHRFFEEERDDFNKYTYLAGQKSFRETFQEKSNLEVHANLMTALDQNNYKYTTPVQEQVIEEGILDGQNMIITSENGSGKTLSYLLPVINDLNKFKDEQEIAHGI